VVSECFGPHCTLQSLSRTSQSCEIHTDHVQYYVYTCTKNERSTNDLQNSNGVPQMVVQEDIPSETACTNTTHSNRKNSQPSERNFPLRLSPSLTHYSHMLFWHIHHACVSITHSSTNTTSVNILKLLSQFPRFTMATKTHLKE